MVIGAEVVDGSHLSFLVLLARDPVLLFLGNVVDAAVLVRLAIGISHWSIVTAARVTFFLQMALFLAITADNVGVPGTIRVSLVVVASGSAAVVLGYKPVALSLNCGHLLHLILSEVLPGNGFSFHQLEFSFNSCNFLGTSVIRAEWPPILGRAPSSGQSCPF
jgi:hypothetical protein